MDHPISSPLWNVIKAIGICFLAFFLAAVAFALFAPPPCAFGRSGCCPDNLGRHQISEALVASLGREGAANRRRGLA
jgi:hypothetical protein